MLFLKEKWKSHRSFSKTVITFKLSELIYPSKKWNFFTFILLDIFKLMTWLLKDGKFEFQAGVEAWDFAENLLSNFFFSNNFNI